MNETVVFRGFGETEAMAVTAGKTGLAVMCTTADAEPPFWSETV